MEISVTRANANIFSKFEFSTSFCSGFIDQNGTVRRTYERLHSVIRPSMRLCFNYNFMASLPCVSCGNSSEIDVLYSSLEDGNRTDERWPAVCRVAYHVTQTDRLSIDIRWQWRYTVTAWRNDDGIELGVAEIQLWMRFSVGSLLSSSSCSFN